MLRIIYIVSGLMAFSIAVAVVFRISSYYAYEIERDRVKSTVLLDTSGKPWKLSDLGNRVGVIFFGYTFCPDICPTTLNDLSIALQGMGPERDTVQPIFISVDPGRDNPTVIREYISQFDKSIIGLTGDPDAIKSFAWNFGATYSTLKSNPEDKSYIVEHSANVFIASSSGRRIHLPIKNDPDELRDTILNAAQSIIRSDRQ
jgi:protein SCO1/2